jgi:hypothetical protein
MPNGLLQLLIFHNPFAADFRACPGLHLWPTKTTPMKTQILRLLSSALGASVLVLGSQLVYSCMSPQRLAQAGGFIEIQQSPIYTRGPKKIDLAMSVNHNAEVVRLPMEINSPYVELKPALSPNGRRLYFSRSNHPSNTAGTADNEDIWYSDYDSVNSKWSKPMGMPGMLNNDGPNFITNVSVTGDSIILGNQYLKNGRMKNGISYSVNINGSWTEPRAIVVKNDYNISPHAGYFLSLKYGVIISAIERDHSYGGRDLHISFWNGEFGSEPMNLGAVLNSDLDEASPHLSPDGKTLFFASRGHGGYGGYDIFVSHRLDDTWTNWSSPQNLGPAVNGELDDEFFIISHCGRYVFFSKQVSVHNVDLFAALTEELFDNAVWDNFKVKRSAFSINFN